jgi:hypothetical protein
MRGVLAVCAFMLLLLALSCGGERSEQAASVASFIRFHEVLGVVEPSGVVAPKEGEQECVLAPPAGGHGPLFGTCEWKVRHEGGGVYVVEITERWDCDDYNARVGSEDFCRGEEGAHTWQYAITPEGGVEYITDSGDPPPESLAPDAPAE